MVSFFVKVLLTYVHNIVYLYSELHYYISRREERIMARPTKQRCICSLPLVTGFSPQGCKASGSINLTYDEYEVLRLLDHMQMTQEQCAKRMQISRPTVTRIYDEARRKMADMLVGGKSLTIGGGDVFVCPAMRPECAGEEHCCHKDPELSRGVRSPGEDSAGE